VAEWPIASVSKTEVG